MRVLLVSANTERMNMPVLPLGLGCISRAVQEAGHDLQMVNLMDQEDVSKALDESIKGFKPDVIGISVRNIDDQTFDAPRFLLEPVKSMISLCRGRTDSLIVIGGAGYSIFPQSALEYLGADMGIAGEGERPFVSLLEHIENKRDLSSIPGLYMQGKGLQTKKALTAHLDDYPIPLPGEHLCPPVHVPGQEVWVPFQTRRGCPMQCSYCSTPLIEGRITRRRDPRLAARMLAEYAEVGFDRFFFVDNTFNLPTDYAKTLCDEIIAQDLAISWRCIIYPWKVDEELVEKMARAGCVEISLGSESGSPKILKNMNKKFSPQEVRKISDTFKKHAIHQMGFLLLGGPGETGDTVRESLEHADSLGLESMKITMGIRIYPHTPLALQAAREGIIKLDEDLLFPKFYMAKGLAPWLKETINEWLKDRPGRHL